ncbi:hypothetical protein [Jejuia pallidilutea]|uniref:Uncharacterized protein n=1 Tax=Jejuia pallidilutea TaxID=504487 RepID=A0A098LQB9_9FLAO|nr:hypothetical protein [Jejuia pallidilutea]GAL88323.1 hypothetical protein JCM19538_1649 [Jejuia pallidilutea]
MIKNYLVFAKWRQKDVEFLNSLKLKRVIEKGYCGILIEDDDTLRTIRNRYSKQNTLLNRISPPEFSITFQGVTFSKKELDAAKCYMLPPFGKPKGFPLPKETYQNELFSFECGNYRVNRKQIGLFRINKPKWSKNQVTFHLDWEWDCIFFKKEFYQEVLAPLGLKYKEVIDNRTKKPLEDTIQLDIPVAQSKLLIENSAYDLYSSEERCGKKQYARQYLDFFPSFEKEFDFNICYTQEEFDGGFKRVVISKEFCKLLVKHKIIKYQTGHLIPMKHI